MALAEMEEIRASLENNGQQSAIVKEVQYLAGDTIVHMGKVTPVTQEELKQGSGGTSGTRRFADVHGSSLSTMPNEALDWYRCPAPRRNVSGMRISHVSGT